ncbi:unnamed protein product [Amaranthus hypochondriacus]
MDLHEWDLVSDESFLEFLPSKSVSNTTTIIDTNYFQKFCESEKKNNSRANPVPIHEFKHLDDTIGEIPKEVIKFPIETINPNDQQNKEIDHQETVSQVFFKKLKEDEFVDMKMDSPKSLNKGITPQIDVGNYQFEEFEKKELEEKSSIIDKDEKIISMDEVSGNSDDENNEDLNIWKWAMTGIGAFFSFGFAVATVSLVVLGNRHKESTKKQEIHFQIFSQDKRMKQAMERAKKLNEAITIMRGAPVSRAHITIGGYYEGL